MEAITQPRFGNLGETNAAIKEVSGGNPSGKVARAGKIGDFPALHFLLKVLTLKSPNPNPNSM